MFNSSIRVSQILVISLVFGLLCLPAQATNSDLFTDAIERLHQGNHQEASLILDEILQENTQHLKARKYRCFANLNLDQYEKAIEDCSEVIQQDSKQLQAYLWRGLAYYRRGNYQQAISNYNQILDQNVEHPQALYNRGLAKSSIGLLSSAITDYNQALQLSDRLNATEKAMIYNDRGIIYLQQQQYDQARKDFSQAIQFDKNDARSLYNLGCVCHYLGEHYTAIKHFTQSLDQAPNNASAYINRGLAWHQLDYTASAIEDLKQGENLLKYQGKFQAAKEIHHLISQLESRQSSVSFLTRNL